MHKWLQNMSLILSLSLSLKGQFMVDHVVKFHGVVMDHVVIEDHVVGLQNQNSHLIRDSGVKVLVVGVDGVHLMAVVGIDSEN